MLREKEKATYQMHEQTHLKGRSGSLIWWEIRLGLAKVKQQKTYEIRKALVQISLDATFSYIFCCSLPENILSLTQKYIRFI